MLRSPRMVTLGCFARMEPNLQPGGLLQFAPLVFAF